MLLEKSLIIFLLETNRKWSSTHV